MNKEQIIKGLRKIEANYLKRFTKEQVIIWVDIFSDWDEELFNSSIDEHIKSEHYFPVIADIYKHKGDTFGV